MSGTLSGKSVMVLGGSGPYGGPATRALGREGANVALGVRDRQKLEELEAQVRSLGGEALVLAAETEGIDDVILGRLPEVASAASVPRGFEKFDGIAGGIL